MSENTKPPKIVIVEDSIVSAMMMEATINRKKPEFDVTVRKTLKGTWEEIAKAKPVLIILDLSLPDSPDGEQAIAAIKQFRDADICVIAVSGHADLESIARAAGANDFMLKSIGENAQPFIERVNALLPQCS